MHSKGFSGKSFFIAGNSNSNLAALSFHTVNEFIYILTPFVLVLVGLLFLGSILYVPPLLRYGIA